MSTLSLRSLQPIIQKTTEFMDNFFLFFNLLEIGFNEVNKGLFTKYVDKILRIFDAPSLTSLLHKLV